MKKTTMWAMVAVVAAWLPNAAVAQSQSQAQQIAATLQAWRDACGDPNPDLARGYLADALATGNADVRQACLRQIAVSDSADLKSAALRVIITSLPFVRFRVQEPEGRFTPNVFAPMKSGVSFLLSEPQPETGTAKWSSLLNNTDPSEEYAGTVRVLGNGIRWAGNLNHVGGYTVRCDLTAELGEQMVLVGVLNCTNNGEFPVAASLLD